MKNLKWIYYITKRFSRVDGKTRSAVTSVMPALGIGFGVMALIVVMAVMNGFQRGSIDALLEISSYHIRVTPSDIFNKENFLTKAKDVMKSNKLDANSLIDMSFDEADFHEEIPEGA